MGVRRRLDGLSEHYERARRHVGWLRTEGLGRLVREDDLHPVQRARRRARNASWRRHHGGPPGSARAVLVVGLQRSGTNMFVKGFTETPRFEVYNENHRKVFDRFQLDHAAASEVVRASRNPYVVFKALCDSHDTVHLLDRLAPAYAIWMFRGVDARARSAVEHFGDANRRSLVAIADGRGAGLWQAGGLSAESLDLIHSFRVATLSPHAASALLWLVRNSLFFETGLDARPDVAMASYERLVRDPVHVLGGICDFLGAPYEPSLTRHITCQPAATEPVDLEPRLRRLCTDMEGRLAEAAAARLGGRVD